MACRVCKKQYFMHSTEESSFDSDEKPHVCVICGRSFSLKVQLKKHMETHKDDMPFVCYACEKESNLTYNLRLPKKGSYGCDECNKTFESKRLLLQHASEHDLDEFEEITQNVSESRKHSVAQKVTKVLKKQKVDSEKNYQCNLCEKRFHLLSALNRHSLSHTKIKSNKYKKYSFQKDVEHCYETKLTSVKDSNDDEVKKYPCLLCSKAFARKSALEGHILTHAVVKSECAEDETDNDEDNLHIVPNERHDPKNITHPRCLPKLKLQHSYSCNVCEKVCSSELLLEKHMHFHKKNKKHSESSNKKKYRCRICKELFLSKPDYKKHKASHGPKENVTSNEKKIKTYMCEVCLADFNKKKLLKKHLKTHASVASSQGKNAPKNQTNPETPNSKKRGRNIGKKSKNYACSKCGKLFAGTLCLKKHELKHENEPENTGKGKKNRSSSSLTCPFCNEDFTGRKFLFMKHKMAHTPEVCGICDERFVDRDALKEHLKTHIGSEEARTFIQCSSKAFTLKNNPQPEPKVECIYLVLR